MQNLDNPQIKAIFDGYPASAKEPMLRLRQWIYEVAAEHELTIEESIKWGEPSYRSEQGSPVRLGVRDVENPVCCVFFQCQTSLVETFRELYDSELHFDGKRAILLPANKKFPEQAVRHCLALALRYHQLKKLPSLGA